MPTVFSHAIIGLAAGAVFQHSRFVSDSEEAPRPAYASWRQALEEGHIPLQMKFICLSVACSTFPDMDVIGFALDIPYGHALGHRGFFHSIFFALLLALAAVAVFFPRASVSSRQSWFLVGYFFALTASHGLLDTLTSGGFGIALLSPFDQTRYRAPVALFEAAPLDLSGLFTPWGLRCIKAEFCAIWVPALAVMAWTRWKTPGKSSNQGIAKREKGKGFS